MTTHDEQTDTATTASTAADDSSGTVRTDTSPTQDETVAPGDESSTAPTEPSEMRTESSTAEAEPSTDDSLFAHDDLSGLRSRWDDVQAAFVDDPPGAVGDADRLVIQVMRERGYPVDDFDQRAADISVDHPNVVEHYRAAHTLHLAQEHGDIGTEAEREAFVHYRALFDKLLETDLETDDAQKEART